MDVAKALGSTSLFKDFAPDELALLASSTGEKRFAAGETLFREGDSGSEMYVILLGGVLVVKRDDKGDDEEVARLGSGDCFGEMAVVDTDHRRTATITALEQTSVLVISQARVEALCERDSAFGRSFYREIARRLSRRLSATSGDVTHYRALWRSLRRH